jgi:nitroreductase
MKEIFNRVSVRQFTSDKVEAEKIEKMLRAAMQAPSAGNQQPWEFIVVENKDTLSTLAKASPYSKCLSEAPLAIVVMANKKLIKYSENWQQDLGAATQNILLEAVSLGLGAVWLGIAPLEDRMNYVSEVFGLDDDLLVYSILPIGYAAVKNEAKERYDVSRIHREKY